MSSPHTQWPIAYAGLNTKCSIPRDHPQVVYISATTEVTGVKHALYACALSPEGQEAASHHMHEDTLVPEEGGGGGGEKSMGGRRMDEDCE